MIMFYYLLWHLFATEQSMVSVVFFACFLFCLCFKVYFSLKFKEFQHLGQIKQWLLVWSNVSNFLLQLLYPSQFWNWVSMNFVLIVQSYFLFDSFKSQFQTKNIFWNSCSRGNNVMFYCSDSSHSIFTSTKFPSYHKQSVPTNCSISYSILNTILIMERRFWTTMYICVKSIRRCSALFFSISLSLPDMFNLVFFPKVICFDFSQISFARVHLCPFAPLHLCTCIF